eukprot:1953805-Rhodomonas_salina.1
MPQCLALHQHPRKRPCSLITKLVTAHIEMSQHSALPQHPRKAPRSLIAKLIVAQIKMSQQEVD